jgi:lactate dehydrogenase-like 2-hydroxyacid dehydrogenase
LPLGYELAGGTVDERALEQALSERRLAGAALDVVACSLVI